MFAAKCWYNILEYECYLSIKAPTKTSKTSMHDISNIAIIGGADENPAYFETQIEPTKLTTAYEVCVSSICHGEVYNIHEGNNTVYFYHGNRLEIERVKQIRGKARIISRPEEVPEQDRGLYNPSSLSTVQIPKGNYESSINLFWVIASVIRDTLGLTKKRDGINPSLDKMYNVISVEMTGIYLLIEGVTDGPWSLLGVHADQYENFTVMNKDLYSTEFPAIIHANIVENSYVNGKLTHKLGIVPIKNRVGWSFYMPKNPTYVPIAVREFSKIKIMLRDINNEYIRFNPFYKTVITLNIRPIKGNSVEL